MSNSLRIVFMGTPEFAVASLDALVNSRHQVVGVVTVPDKPASRGLKLTSSAVKDYAVAHNLPVLQPEKLKNEVFIAELKNLSADLQVVVAFRMLPEIVWSMPRLGTINLHGSLLPQYRGAAPINWAVINGEKETGVTTFLLQHAIDTGDILYKENTPITDSDDAGTVHDRLMAIGAKLIVKTVDALADGTAKPVKQEAVAEGDLKTAPKIFREHCKVDWNKSATEKFNFVRGLSPYPGAWTELATDKGKTVIKIYKCKADSQQAQPGQVIIKDNRLFVGCKSGSLEILELQAEGKKRMDAASFLRGFPLDKGGFTFI
jgi:methionyl-tRNA formyltransferase